MRSRRGGLLGTTNALLLRILRSSVINRPVHVEHKQPKKHHAALKYEWSNWLLACTNCNSTKSEKNTPLADTLWPDRDNTARAFAYGVSGVVSLNAGLSPAITALAGTLRDLVGLDRTPAHPSLSKADRRWHHRLAAYDLAIFARDGMNEAANDTDLRELAVRAARATGFFSVWMAVFNGDPDMRVRLLSAFSAAPDCYDAATTEVPRPGGMC